MEPNDPYCRIKGSRWILSEDWGYSCREVDLGAAGGRAEGAGFFPPWNPVKFVNFRPRVGFRLAHTKPRRWQWMWQRCFLPSGLADGARVGR